MLITVVVSVASSALVLVGGYSLGALSLNVNTLSLWLVGTAVLAVLCAFVTNQIIQPARRRLYELEEAAALIASGRLQHRVPTMDDTDEIGRVAEQFNKMGETIEQNVAALQRLAEENRILAAESEQSATLSERQRLARELHDSVSQELFAVSMLASSAVRQYETGSDAVTGTLRQLAELAAAAQREMRALLLHLRPMELEGRGLSEGLAAFMAAIEERHQLQHRLTYEVEDKLVPSVEEQLFRIAQEAVANVLKHAGATEIRLAVTSDGRLLKLSVLDDGIGIPESIQSGDSYGISAMKERAAQLGGRCEIWRREHGTAVEVQIPIVKRTEEQA